MDNATTVQRPEPVVTILDFVRQYAHDNGLTTEIFDNAMREDNNWLYIPVRVDGKDVIDKAKRLQQIEDAWKEQQPEPYRQVLLIPVK